RDFRIRIFVNHWVSRVAALGHAWIDGNLTQEWHAGILREFLPAAVPENLVTLAIVTDKITHVLHDAENRDLHLTKHLDAATGHGQAHILRCDDGHDA